MFVNSMVCQLARLLSAGALTLLLAACGGGGESGNKTDPPVAGDPVPEHPDVPVPSAGTLEEQLRQLASASGVAPLGDAPAVTDALFNLGRALFEGTTGALLSGTRTVSCAACHQTNNAGVETAVALHASLGRQPTIHRNAPDLVNRALGGRRSMFWDGRVSLDEQGRYHTPAGDKLPLGLHSLLSAQALFPLLSRDEMLGYRDDGSDDNELADLSPAAALDSDPWPVWNGIVARVKANATLNPLLVAAYPDVAFDDLGIQHIANALAAFQTRRWNPVLVPAHFHAWLAGTGDLTDQAKRGGILFFGKARCAVCHNGPLLTDGEFHNLAVPQLGPGFASGASETPPRDKGRYEVSGDEADLYAFLTPSLWEIKATPPYMHNGVYRTLEQAVRHHLDASAAANRFRCEDAPAGVACRDSETSPDLYTDMVHRLASQMSVPIALTEEEISDLLAFLNQLTNGAN
ncbi:MAG: cytochrome c peroxidase [Gammaproteobacteria bacterium]